MTLHRSTDASQRRIITLRAPIPPKVHAPSEGNPPKLEKVAQTETRVSYRWSLLLELGCCQAWISGSLFSSQCLIPREVESRAYPSSHIGPRGVGRSFGWRDRWIYVVSIPTSCCNNTRNANRRRHGHGGVNVTDVILLVNRAPESFFVWVTLDHGPTSRRLRLGPIYRNPLLLFQTPKPRSCKS